MADELVKALLKTYQVGFGDCFLLTFLYKDEDERHVLIDFGSTGLPESAPKDQMLRVAKKIKEHCGERGLDIVIATHRHKDHISGFSTAGKGETSGAIIKECKPKIVLQPWTEHPDLEGDASAPPSGLPGGDDEAKAFHMHYAQSLNDMNLVSEQIKSEVERLADPDRFTKTLPKAIVDRLNFLAVDNGIKNASAVENLNNIEKGMSGKRQYLKYGDEIEGLSDMLPGVNVKVLGPPTLEQYEGVKNQRSKDANQFWMLYAATAGAVSQLRQDNNADDDEDPLFPKVPGLPDMRVYSKIPVHSRWFVRKLRFLRADQLLQIVRILDNSMNNTSLILLFEAGRQKMLFPGDAQIENWEYALRYAADHKKNADLLKETTLYKVGHHGSRNATPKTLWDNFDKAHDDVKNPDRLRTIVSTMTGKHGNPDQHTEVPRQTLVDALSSKSHYYSTQKLEPTLHDDADDDDEPINKFTKKEVGLWGEIEIDL